MLTNGHYDNNLLDILNINYFQLFQLPLNYFINADDLEAQYLALQGILHPDKALNDHLQSELLMKCSARINEAYTILQSPIDRARVYVGVTFRQK